MQFIVLCNALQKFVDEQMTLILESRQKIEKKTTIKKIDIMLRTALDGFLWEEKKDECEDEQSEFSTKFK